MKRYKTKPVEVSALQFDPCGEHRYCLPDGVSGVPVTTVVDWAAPGCKFHVVVQQGEHLYKVEIRPLDWIVISDDGRWRVCAKEAFEQGFVPAISLGTTFISEHIQ